MSDSAAFSGDIPRHYDEGLGPVQFVPFAEDMAKRVAEIGPANVLETAAGTGIVTRRLRDALPVNANLTSTDLQAPMLDIARTKFRPGERISFQTADATALPFGDATFDVVVCQFGVMFFPDKDLAYREVMRVLKSGGTYLFSVWDSHANNTFARITNEMINAAFPVDPPTFMTIPFGYGFDPIKASLVAAGFADITASVVKLVSNVIDLERYARGFVYGSPIIDQVKARGGIDPEQLVTSLTASFRREFGDPPRATLQALVFSARKL
jgi:SAM-dependent methyltransferase